MEKGENDAFTFPSKSNQTWNIPRATKLGTCYWPPSWGFPLLLSFSFFLKT
jgi:hypothetical protein